MSARPQQDQPLLRRLKRKAAGRPGRPHNPEKALETAPLPAEVALPDAITRDGTRAYHWLLLLLLLLLLRLLLRLLLLLLLPSVTDRDLSTRTKRVFRPVYPQVSEPAGHRANHGPECDTALSGGFEDLGCGIELRRPRCA